MAGWLQHKNASPVGTALLQSSLRDSDDLTPYPALKRRAIFIRLYEANALATHAEESSGDRPLATGDCYCGGFCVVVVVVVVLVL